MRMNKRMNEGVNKGVRRAKLKRFGRGAQRTEMGRS